MTFEEYIATLPKMPSKVKMVILKRLWDEGQDFPRGWVRSSELLGLTGQKYFDRRVRELRDNVGCEIETGQRGNEHAYRLNSSNTAIATPRAYLPNPLKKELFRASKYRCAICDRQFVSGLRGLQADHRVPLNRGGSNGDGNWQSLCVECNVGKRKACAGCDLDCQICPWAFPDRVGKRILIQLPQETELLIREYAAHSGKTFDSCVAEGLTQYLVQIRETN